MSSDGSERTFGTAKIAHLMGATFDGTVHRSMRTASFVVFQSVSSNLNRAALVLAVEKRFRARIAMILKKVEPTDQLVPTKTLQKVCKPTAIVSGGFTTDAQSAHLALSQPVPK